MSDLFRDSSSAFFIVGWKGNFETSETASSNRRTEQTFVNIPSAVIYLIRTWAETKILVDLHRDNELLYPSFNSFHAQFDCKITNVLEKWGETLDFVLCVSLRSSVRLVYLPTILSCSSRSLRALQQSSTVVLGDQSFFLVSWVEWVKDIGGIIWFSWGTEWGSVVANRVQRRTIKIDHRLTAHEGKLKEYCRALWGIRQILSSHTQNPPTPPPSE